MQTKVQVKQTTRRRQWIVDRSREAAETGAVWTMNDHDALIKHLRDVNQLAIDMVRAAQDGGSK